MRIRFILAATLLLATPIGAGASIDSVPGSANWYFHVDLERMRSGGAGAAIYEWLRDEVLDEVKDDAGIDIDKEIDRITSYSSPAGSTVLSIDGNLSQETRDIIMAFIATGGDLDARKSDGKTYFHFTGDDKDTGQLSSEIGDVVIDIDSLSDNSYISLALKNKVIVTSSEDSMRTLLANKGRLAGGRGNKGALLVLTAEKSLLQAGMQAGAINADWDSNILRNTEQVAFLVAVAANKLAIEAKLVTKEAEMAEHLASVVRGLISLMSFSDEMDAATIETLRGTRVKANGNSLSISLAVDPSIVEENLRD